MSEPIKVIPLEHPFEFGKETITELAVNRRPKAKDLRGLPQHLGQDEMQTILGRITGQPPAVIGELDIVDLFAALEVVESFLPDGPTTGPTV